MRTLLSNGRGAIARPAVGIASLERIRIRDNRAEEVRQGRRQVVVAWLGSRILVLLCAAFVQQLGFPRASWSPGFARHPFALLATWDGKWYRTIAEHGYLLIPGKQSNPAFFPLLPIILRGLRAVGFPYDAAGIVVGNICFLVALLALYELGREWLPEGDARRAVVYAAVFPFSFVFSMAYPEGLALAAMTLGGLFALRRRWLAAALCASLATLARPEGALVILPVIAAATRSWPFLSQPARARAYAAILAPIATIAGVSLYFWSAVGDPVAWSDAQRGWGRSLALTGPYHALAELATSPTHHKEWLFRDGAFMLIYLACLLIAWRRGLPRAWIAAGFAIVLLPLATGSIQSEARFGLLAVPVYWGLAQAGRLRWSNRLILLASPALLAAGVFTILLRWP